MSDYLGVVDFKESLEESGFVLRPFALDMKPIIPAAWVFACLNSTSLLAQDVFVTGGSVYPATPVLVYPTPVVYQSPVIYQAPVFYQAPVLYQAPVVYQTPVVYDAIFAPPCSSVDCPQPSATVVFIGGSQNYVRHYYPDSCSSSSVIYFGSGRSGATDRSSHLPRRDR